ncbi:MAG: hypothetical protein WAM96_07805 [Candidatus Acidiferrales bacterium]
MRAHVEANEAYAEFSRATQLVNLFRDVWTRELSIGNPRTLSPFPTTPATKSERF